MPTHVDEPRAGPQSTAASHRAHLTQHCPPTSLTHTRLDLIQHNHTEEPGTDQNQSGSPPGEVSTAAVTPRDAQGMLLMLGTGVQLS